MGWDLIFKGLCDFFVSETLLSLCWPTAMVITVKYLSCNPTFTRWNSSWWIILCKRKLWNLLVQKSPDIYLHSLSRYFTVVICVPQVELHQENDAFWRLLNWWQSLKTDIVTPGYTAFSRWLLTLTVLYQKSRWDTWESPWPNQGQPALARAATEGSSAGVFHFMAGLKGPTLTSAGGIRRESARAPHWGVLLQAPHAF